MFDHARSICICLSIASYVIPATAQDLSEWQTILSYETQTGWQQLGPGRFVVEDSLLRTEGGMGLYWFTERPFRNAVLRVVYRNPGGTNSGVFIRIPEPPEDVWTPVNRGYEVQIDDRGDDYHVTGVLYSMTKARARPSRPDEWNTMEITLDGPRTVVQVNGVVVTDYIEGDPIKKKPWWQFWKIWEPKRGPRPIEGYVGLQNHGSKDRVEFREVSFREIRHSEKPGDG